MPAVLRYYRRVSGECGSTGKNSIAPRTWLMVRNGAEYRAADRARIYYELALPGYILLQAGVADHLVRAKIINYRLNDESRILHWHQQKYWWMA